ncbi:MAG TPA: hypothetical protein PLU52_01470 [Opitutaceae bacterium]|nr:hypothetical protein [Opitutaceae bacterium]HND61457.1 hypothetical protein [Opitutaceae bacterium]
MAPLDRPTLIATVRQALEPQPWAHALWEGGSAGFGRADQWSDVDLQAEVDDDKVAATFAAVEAALAKVAQVSLVFAVPEPAWHGHSQRFYRFANAEPWLILDFCVIKRGGGYKFNEPDVHGRAPVLFDRSGLFGSHVVKTDRAALETRLRGRIEALRVRFAMFQVLVDKETWRGNPIDALHFYQGLTLAPLVELLRIKHDPLRSTWGNRYLHRTLPTPEADRLAKLMYVATPDQVAPKRAEAETWFNALADELSARKQLVPPS